MVLAPCDALISLEGNGRAREARVVPAVIDRQRAGFRGQGEGRCSSGRTGRARTPPWVKQPCLSLAAILRKVPATGGARPPVAGPSPPFISTTARQDAVAVLMEGKTGLPPELRDFPYLLLGCVKQGCLSDPATAATGACSPDAIWAFAARRAVFSAGPIRRGQAPCPPGPVLIDGERG